MKFLLGIFLAGAMVQSAHAASRPFDAWLRDFRQEALRYGISRPLVERALPDTLTPNEKVLRLDRKQPEGTVSFERYKSNTLTAGRVQKGRDYMLRHRKLLKQISDTYGVEPQYIVALWGIETNFGENTGGFEIIPALVTLAYEGRRGDFFRQELLKALRIVDQGHVALHEMKGSWAGAMGQCQFMPSSFERHAKDYNKDGKRDIWKSEADVFASIAAYLSESGWQAGRPLQRLVALPKNHDNKMIGFFIQKPLQFWRDAGIRLADGTELPFDTDEHVSIVQPGGVGYKAYVVYNNYRILIKWNTSSYFATVVSLFADRLKG